ncbi:MAG: class I SAM-dependent methyltransferase, partial [Pseudomonadota bacterium]
MVQLKRLVAKARGRHVRVQKPPKPAVNDVLIARAAEDSADFIEPFLDRALLMRRTDEIRDLAIRRAPKEGLVMELGVYKAVGINQFAQVLSDLGDRRTLYGFDAFKGLSEDWYGKSLPALTAFNRKGRPPKVRKNVELVIGWVEDTVAPFLDSHGGPVAFVHMDTDTYSPCRYALERLKPRMAEGALILFDEHHGYPNWQNGEFRALNEVFE